MKQFRKQTVRKQVNEFITYNNLRVIGEQGQLGVMSKNRALQVAYENKIDIVIINEKSDPPIAKLINANKFFYEQKRKEKETAKKKREK